jgi:hypothetical protein
MNHATQFWFFMHFRSKMTTVTPVITVKMKLKLPIQTKYCISLQRKIYTWKRNHASVKTETMIALKPPIQTDTAFL